MYSVTAETKEYSLKADYEGDEVASASTPGIGTAYAATGNPQIAYIKGTYNGVVAKASTGSRVNLLAVPNIVTATGVVSISDGVPAGFLVQ